MSWTAPITWVANTLVLDSMLNPQIRDNLAVLATSIDTGSGKIQAINATYVLSLAGLLTIQNQAVTAASSVGAGETTLQTYSLPGGTLANANIGIRITAWGSVVNNANTKIVRQYFGAAFFGFSGMLTASQAQLWGLKSCVFRQGATAQSYFATFQSGPTGAVNSNVSNAAGTLSQTLSGAVIVKVTGQGTTTGDVTCAGQMIEVFQQ